MKKRKRSSKNKPLTQEEIWDDSALIESWEEAAEEYKLYHSIQAKGQKVEDVLREAEASNGNEDVMQVEHITGIEAVAEDHAVNLSETVIVEESEGKEKYTGGQPVDHSQDNAIPDAVAEDSQPAAGGPASGSFASMPQMVINGAPNPPNIQDEALKNLMMSWYFAGYYTGLYEGQQRAGAKQ
ncbi:uncharacterized protein GIQ15_01485 [Arthroderma uncinatum]|uniref:uncharacterized protein n=1 Tax=Arthroderma uncinatum TaxID=74035 RepID=UPI00144AC9E9|nr:uncharacterized protein GIQ15_01485 [Arthroderma uncinatum]KAF3491968.1 hypothetical protein GIQ15_01485 [Arthroderma uncinatum]